MDVVVWIVACLVCAVIGFFAGVQMTKAQSASREEKEKPPWMQQ